MVPARPVRYDPGKAEVAPLMVKGAQTVRNCRIAEEPKGVLINAVSKQPLSYKDACVENDPHVNHDADATRAARVAVKDFLRATFKLE